MHARFGSIHGRASPQSSGRRESQDVVARFERGMWFKRIQHEWSVGPSVS
jgi:hypothetical protein